MKASLKFRDGQKPLFRAKVPLAILGLPFQSSLAAGSSKDITLSLATFFDSGPAIRASYRPNDASNPLSVTLKTGIGAFGSPIEAPMTMKAEFNLVGGSPAFFLHFKPRIGDFSIRKSQSSSEIVNRMETKRRGCDSSEDEGYVDVVDPPAIRNGAVLTRSASSIAAVFDTALAGMEVGARTVMPIRNGAVLKLRWGVRFPDELKKLLTKKGEGNLTAGIPLLMMNKIGIEHVARDDDSDGRSKSGTAGTAEVADTCIAVRRQLAGLHSESERMRKAMEEFRSEFAKRPYNSASPYNSANGTGKINGTEAEGGHVKDEHKKALNGA